jgi:flagellar hook-length control protein FliK
VAHAAAPNGTQTAQSAKDLADRVADTLRTSFDSGGELRVRLEPPALGKIQIEVQADSGAVSARLEVQTPAARQTLLDNISLLHQAIGQTGATVSRIDIEVATPQQDSTGSDPRDTSGGNQQDSGNSNSQDRSGNSAGGNQKQNQGWWRSSAIEEIDIEI